MTPDHAPSSGPPREPVTLSREPSGPVAPPSPTSPGSARGAGTVGAAVGARAPEAVRWPVPRCAHPVCFERGGGERGRYTRKQVEAFDAVQLRRVAVFGCPTFPGLFHTRALPGWRI
ncbi:hypothetical protein Lfu02_56000 [Longispora fulva]|nr:hypothetical protein Lfu02_56000 [Longispora fulva]